MNLDSWIHGVINSNLENDEEFRRFAGKDFLHLPSRSEVETYQLYRLNKALRYCRENSSFYRELFRAAGAPTEDICDLRDLAKFPFTEPRYLSESPYRFLCTSQAEIARPYSFITSGTTGPKKKIFWTQDDLDRITSFMSAGISTVADPGDTIVILLPDGKPNSQADLLRQGVLKLGATPVVANPDLTANELLAVVEESRCKVIFGYTRNIFRLSKELERQHDLRKKGVAVLFLAAEYLPHGMRQQLKRIWNCDIRTHYGLTEMGLGVAVECEAQNGYHFNEADLLLEVVHPGTGTPVPAGEEGELVFTTLTREAMPLVRYRTHDLSRLIVEPCACGTGSLLKIDIVKKRIESIATVGDGDEIYPALFDDVLFEIPGVVDYQVIAAQENGMDRLDFKIEMIPDQTGRVSDIRKMLFSAPVIAKNIAAQKMLEPVTRPGRHAVRLLQGALPAPARDGEAALRLRLRGLLAGHRQPRPVPPGELRRARRARAPEHPRDPAARQRLGGEGVDLDDLEAVEAPAFIGNYCRIAPRASVGPYSVLMPSVTLGDHARTARSVVDASTSIGRSAVVEGAIVGRACDIRPHARLHEGVAVGDNCTIGEESVVMPGVRIYPFKEVESGSLVDRNLIWESRLSSRLIGMDGVVGRINVDLTPETALRLGLALGTALDRGDRVVTSRAASASCRLIRRALIAGVNSAGVHAADLQVMPAAVNRHFLKTEGFDAGIHVQPSPNDPEVVQIRIFEPPGTPATPALVKEIDKHFSRQEFRRASWNEVGEITYSARTAETYVQDLLATLDTGRSGRAASASSSTTPSRQPRSSCRRCWARSTSRRSPRTPTSASGATPSESVTARRVARPGEAARGSRRRRPRRRPRPGRRADLPRRRQGPRGAGRAGAPPLPPPARLGRQARPPGLPDDGHEPRRRARRGHRARGRSARRTRSRP